MATINGTAGNDNLTGTTGADTIDGLGGNDSLLGADGNDSVVGGAGNDTVRGNNGTDWIEGGAGNDNVGGGSGQDSFVFREAGTANADVFNDFASAWDNIRLDAAFFTALGSAGQFTAGDNRFWSSTSGTAHDADDRIIYNSTTRQLWYDADGNGSGAAQLIGTLNTGATVVATDIRVFGTASGGGGNQTINGTSGNDSLVGGPGNDTINGFEGDDTLSGNDGDDSLVGGAGADQFFGGLGNDTYVVDGSDAIGFDTGGVDTVVSLTSNWTLGTGFENLRFEVPVTTDAGGFFDWIHVVGIGNGQANIITGDPLFFHNNSLDGADGDDTLTGGGGGDVFRFEAGSGNYGHDHIDGGDEDWEGGEDGITFYSIDGQNYARSGVVIDFLAGTVTGGGTGGSGSATFVDIEWAVGGDFNDVLTANHGVYHAVSDTFKGPFLFGGGGNDTLWGGDAEDQLWGDSNNHSFDQPSPGSDEIHGGGNNDEFFGGAGADRLFGDAGNDSFYALGGDPGNDTIDGGEGSDTVQGYRSEVVVDLQLGTVTGGGMAGGATLISIENFFGSEFNDSITGSSAANQLRGFGGDDTLDGGIGNDTLGGGDGLSDPGADVFVFSVAPGSANADVIHSFTSGTDKLHLHLAAHSNLGGSGGFSSGDARFWSSSSGAAHDADDRVVYNTSNGQLWYDADGSGAGVAQLIATLAATGSVPSLVAADIVVIGSGGGSMINGTAGSDSLMGTAGNDTINGFAGQDTIDGGAGADSMVGGDDPDVYFVDNLGDVIIEFENGGFDEVRSTINYTLTDWVNNLTLIGTANLRGSGNELPNVITGNGGHNDINGGMGNDTLLGGAGDDWISMHSGSAGVDSDHRGNDSIDGGIGTDSINFSMVSMDGVSSTAAVVINLAAGTYTIAEPDGPASGVVINVENVQGSWAADRITGTSGNNALEGMNGNDTISGGAGNDVLIGSSAASTADADTFLFDVAPGAANADVIVRFASGFDKIILDGAAHANSGASGNLASGDARFWSSATGAAHDADDRVIYNTSNGQLWYDADGNGAAASQLIANLQSLPTLAATDITIVNGSTGGGGGGSTINGTAGNDTLDGTAGDDTINGLGGNDLLRGNEGADLLRGGDGNDTLISGEATGISFASDSAPDTLDGGLGDDVYHVVESDGDVIITDPGGIDTVVAWSDWTLGAGLENLTLGDDAGVGANGTGNELDNHITSATEGGTLRGLGGNDTLLVRNAENFIDAYGGDGNDTLLGGHNQDNLFGDAGDDLLESNAGGGLLTGGTGADTFFFNTPPDPANPGIPVEHVADFISSVDTIRLDAHWMEALGASGRFGAGDARFTANTTGTAQDASDRVVYNRSTGELFYDSDGSGAAEAGLIVTLQGAPTLSATDIEVVNGTAPGGSTINGTANADTLTGTSGNDTINGLGGNDVINATAGADVIDGGAGTDIIQYRTATSGIVANFATGSITGGFTGASVSFSNVEKVLGSNFDDQLTGNASAQNLTGQAGNDTITGGAGIDTLWGGAGNDVFLFNGMGTANADRISDWASGQDKIHLTDEAFSAIGAMGNFAAGDARFWSSTAGTAHDANDRVIYNTSTGQLYYDADGSGGGAAQLVATILNHPAVVATDIVVV